MKQIKKDNKFKNKEQMINKKESSIHTPTGSQKVLLGESVEKRKKKGEIARH